MKEKIFISTGKRGITLENLSFLKWAARKAKVALVRGRFGWSGSLPIADECPLAGEEHKCSERGATLHYSPFH